MVKRKKFNDHPFAYHQEIELEISTLTNLGSGLARVPLGNLELGTSHLELPPANAGGWVVMVPFTLPGERVRARVFRNHKNYSEADLVEVLTPSPDRVSPACPLFGRCGGCQYQHLAYSAQLEWKRRQVAELLQHMAGTEFPVAPVVPSPREFGYRSKITPHFSAPRAAAGSEFGVRRSELGHQGAPSVPLPTPNSKLGTLNSAGSPPFPIGFLRQGTRFDIVDVPHCPIATDGINRRLTALRESVRARAADYPRGATLLLREASGEVTTDYDAIITETIASSAASDSQPSTLDSQLSHLDPQLSHLDPQPAAPSKALRLRFLARDFFQNNPFILPAFTQYVRTQAAASGARFLVDAYCGSGLFALSAASAFEKVTGVEISESSVKFARENAAANGIGNATFQVGDAAAIFNGLDFPAAETAVVIDPPRKGCDLAFLNQLFGFAPRAVIYVSCDPSTQMRDLRLFMENGFCLAEVQPFDLFPQTRHLECVLTLRRKA